MLISGILINIFFTKSISAFDLNLKDDFAQSIINIIVALIFGFFIWSAGFWSQGDAKLFLGYSLLLPVFTYQHGYIPFFPSLAILINTFIPTAIFYFINSFRHIKKRDLKTKVKQIFSPSNLMNLIFFAFSFSFIFDLILTHFNLKLDLILKMIILLILFEILSKISSGTRQKLFAILSILIIAFFFNSVFTASFLSQFLLNVMLILVSNFLLSTTEIYSQSVRIMNLKAGMLLSEPLIITNNGAEKREVSLRSILSSFYSIKGAVENIKTKLTEEDVKQLQKLENEKRLKFAEIKITKTVPFAPFMFFGVLLTYLLQGSILYYILVKL